MNDNVCSLISGLHLGRNFVDNVKRYIQLQLSFTIITLLIVMIGAFYTVDEPISASQLVWTGLIVQVGAPIAFASLDPSSYALNFK